MRFYSESLDLPDSAFLILRDLIHERTGLFYDNGKRELLADKLSPLVLERGFNSFLDYYYLLKYDAEQESEWEKVVNALSVQETFFYREMDQIRALAEVFVPRHFAASSLVPFRIWCSACATGEEPISIAMALAEAGWLGRHPIEIHASDISPAAIQKAKRGVFRERSFRSLPAQVQSRFFLQQDGAWRVAEDIHRKIQWRTINVINREEMAQLPPLSVIFCRNMFIYFSPDAVRKTLRNFYEKLTTPGYLFVGAAESLLKASSDFDLEEIGGAFVYVKRS